MVGPGVSNAFHYGECLLADVSLRNRTDAELPLVIHGALDYLPARLALGVFGEGRYFFATWALYAVLSLISSAVLLVLLLVDLTPQPRRTPAFLLLCGVAASLFVGYRDLFLVIAILSFTLVASAQRRRTAITASVALGLALSLGMLWSWNRGLVGMVGIGGAALILSWRRSEIRWALLSLAIPFIMMPTFNPVFSTGQIARNLAVVLTTGSQWQLGWGLGNRQVGQRARPSHRRLGLGATDANSGPLVLSRGRVLLLDVVSAPRGHHKDGL